jgi:hypothetical protein
LRFAFHDPPLFQTAFLSLKNPDGLSEPSDQSNSKCAVCQNVPSFPIALAHAKHAASANAKTKKKSREKFAQCEPKEPPTLRTSLAA